MDGGFRLFAGGGIGFGAGEIIGSDHEAAFRAFSDRAAEVEGLFEGHPDGRG
jgi:hypothetical protein